MRTEGVIYIGEAAKWAGRACARLNGYPWNVLGGGIVGGVSVGAGCFFASLALEFGAPGWTYLPVMLVVAWPLVVLGVRLIRMVAVGHFRRKLAERGVDNPLPFSVEVEPDVLIIRAGQTETRASWSVVSEVFPLGAYWVFLIQGSPVFVPKRNFVEIGEERTFVRTVLDRLSEGAVKRSSKAVSFAAVRAP
jgi:hypothetical protein